MDRLKEMDRTLSSAQRRVLELMAEGAEARQMRPGIGDLYLVWGLGTEELRIRDTTLLALLAARLVVGHRPRGGFPRYRITDAGRQAVDR